MLVKGISKKDFEVTLADLDKSSSRYPHPISMSLY